MKQRRRYKRPEWANWPNEKLLDVRLCDLDLHIEGTPLEARIAQLYRELEDRRIRFRPYFWLSDDWFTPDGVPGRRDALLPGAPAPGAARAQPDARGRGRHAASGACASCATRPATPSTTPTGCAAAAAASSSSAARRRRIPSTTRRGRTARASSLHLEPWYAQSHPDEDFAETFAVWLTPELGVAQALRRLAGAEEARVRRRAHARDRPRASRGDARADRVEPLSRLRKTLREHYEEKRSATASTIPNVYDRDLRRLFSDAPEYAQPVARHASSRRIRKRGAPHRGALDRRVSVHDRPGARRHHQALPRARPAPASAPRSRRSSTSPSCLTVQTMNYLHSGQHRVWL